MKEIDYEKDVNIDESALDVEWLQQPSLMKRYADMATKAERNEALKKESLDLLRAQFDLLIRKTPEDFKIDKITEAVVANTILTLEDYQEANKEYLEAKFERKNADNAVKAIEQKKTALENLVKLHGQQYFAGPSVPRDLNKEWVEKQNQKNLNAEVNKRITIKRRD